jgi:hypothetical protein
MLKSYTYVEGEFICGEFFMVSGLGCPGQSSVGVTTNGTSSLWLRSNSANVVRNSDDGVTSRSWMLVHKDNAPLQSPRRPIINNIILTNIQISARRHYVTPYLITLKTTRKKRM